MGNTIPHGDRLHDCSDSCPEWPGRGTINLVKGRKVYATAEHLDGRLCSLIDSEDTSVGKVWVWRGDDDMPFACERDHGYGSEVKPNPVDVGRGEFGMPGVGSAGRIVDGIAASIGKRRDGDRLVDATPSEHWMLSSWPGVRTALARRIVDRHLPEALNHFLARNAEYGDDNDFDLGVKGQYVDISRKVQKLKRRWWDGQGDIEYGAGIESDKVVVMELIGHLLMSLDYLEQASSDEAGDSAG